MAGVKPQGLAKRRLRPIEVAELFEQVGQSRMGGCQVRGEAERLAEASLGFGQPPECEQDIAQVVMARGETRLKRTASWQ